VGGGVGFAEAFELGDKASAGLVVEGGQATPEVGAERSSEMRMDDGAACRR
jgi:hypothetical protein